MILPPQNEFGQWLAGHAATDIRFRDRGTEETQRAVERILRRYGYRGEIRVRVTEECPDYEDWMVIIVHDVQQIGFGFG